MSGRLESIFYVSVGAGMALGTSSFTMVSGLFEITDALWIVASVVLAGLCCILVAGSVAELASMFPSAPGVRTYLKAAFGDRTSLVLVYLYLIFVVLIAGVESYMFALVVQAVIPGVSALLVVLALLLFVIGINLAGFEIPHGMQIVSAVLLLGAILVTGAMGLWEGALESAGTTDLLRNASGVEGLGLLPAATAMSVYLFLGFEWVTPLGFRPDSYERKIPRSMPLAITINVVVYSVFVLGLGSRMAGDEIAASSVPQVAYFIDLVGEPGALLAWGMSLLAIFSTFNAGLLGSSRLVFAIAREGVLPSWCARMSMRTGAPVGAILLLGGLVMVSSTVVLTFRLEVIAAVMGACIVSCVYAAFVLAAIRLRDRRPDAHRPFRTPFPLPLQWIVILVLPLIGVGSLLGQPGSALVPVAGMVGLILLAVVLTRWSLAHVAVRRDRQART